MIKFQIGKDLKNTSKIGQHIQEWLRSFAVDPLKAKGLPTSRMFIAERAAEQQTSTCGLKRDEFLDGYGIIENNTIRFKFNHIPEAIFVCDFSDDEPIDSIEVRIISAILSWPLS